jgi:hypothetical protein
MTVLVEVTKANISRLLKLLKKSAPQFEALEKVTYRTKEACEAAKQEVKQLLDRVWDSMSNAQKQPDDRLRDMVPY